MRFDIENKILIPFLLLIIIPTLVVGGVFYWNSNQLFVDSQKNNMAKDLVQVVNYIDSVSSDVRQGYITKEQAKDKALRYLEKSWKDILVFDKDRRKVLMGSDSINISLFGTGKYVWFEENKSKLSAFIQYPEWHWVIGMSHDTKEFTYQLLELQKYTMLIAIIGIIIAVEISILLAHNISRPIKNLAEICDSISLGCLDDRMPVERKDEIGVLARALNNMVLRLQENNKKLEKMKRSNEDILRCIDVGIIAINKEGKIIGINPVASNWMKGDYLVEENDKYVGTFFNALMNNLNRTLRENKPVSNLEWKVEDKVKSQYVVITTGLLRDENEITNGAICSFSDITQRKKVEERIERVNRLVSLGELAAGLAHEIRNPLAGIKTSVQVLNNRFKGSVSNKNLFEGILFEIDRLNDLISDLLNFAKPRPADRARVDIVSIIQKVIELTDNELKKNHIELDISIETQDTMVYVDGNQMKQIFLNIVINAIKAMKMGGSFAIRVYKDEESMFRKLKVSFVDTGVGIENDNLNRIFDPFFTTDAAGTGLGLSVVHKLVTENEGDIEVYSKISYGTTFIIGLPLAGGGAIEKENTGY